MIRHRAVIGAVGGLVVAGGLAAGLLLLPGLHGHQVAAAAPAIPFTAAQQNRLAAGLTAPGLPAQAQVLAAEIRSQFLRDGEPLLPAGSGARIDAATFGVTSADTALVDVAVSGPRPGHWQLLLISERGRWLVIGTRGLR
jgi:hypothetical protein